MALALISPVFKLIILLVAILQSYYKRWVSSTPIWNHGPSTLLALSLYPRPALLVRHSSKWSSLSSLSASGIHKFLMHLCVNRSSVPPLPVGGVHICEPLQRTEGRFRCWEHFQNNDTQWNFTQTSILIYEYGSPLSNKACIYNSQTFKAFGKCLTLWVLGLCFCLMFT